MDNLYRVNAFIKDGEGGNAAGVYVNADHLNDSEMQKIAKDLNYSETAFVLKSDKANFKVRFFTPTHEVELCGHATIATFHILKTLKLISKGVYTQETKAGILKIRITSNDIFMQQKLPIFYQQIDQEEINKCFDEIAYHEELKPYVISTGMKEIFVPIKNKEMIDTLIPDFEKIKALSMKYDSIGMHVFAIDDQVDAYGRNFAPVVGIDEESATGTSNGALACYLSHFYQKKKNYTLKQGDYLGLPSEIKVILGYDDKNQINEIWVGGKAQLIK